MPLFTKAERNEHVVNTGKRIANKDHHSLSINLRKAKRFLDDEYLENILWVSDNEYFFFQAKCCRSFRKNETSHELKISLCIVSGEVKIGTCTCVTGDSGYCNHVLALMFILCKYSLYGCQQTTDLNNEDELQPMASSTSMLQRWRKKGGGSNIAPEPVFEVF